ncbi:Glycine/D-amino acid oxidase [Salinihabitans flavidus]|uniref:Glycine/D-amino acid oxidase n=1 Tax=Salinihabitans flavidus TaxID=569882 RepID=A0A1H8MK44_9RHOB|nr:FAD-dependent oxidoreductase [Salinihabitans flavidus]SEO17689.1 Glycine/D-amino acid oxidase [Salinihabitans flavidus]
MAARAQQVDIVVIGAGMAGASVAAELAGAGAGRIVLLEREAQPGYHTTGRSAAIFTLAYGPPVIRALTRASHPFFLGQGPAGTPQDLLRTRGVMFAARADQREALAALHAELGEAVRPLGADQMAERVPLLRPGYAAAGLIDERAADVDVAALHQHYLRVFRADGGHVVTGAEVRGLTRDGAGWRVETEAGDFTAPVVVNAAGAWADEVAALAGVAPLGLRPLRRTAILVAAPEGMVPDPWPMVVDAEEQFYLKPDAGKLLLSPADATLSPPCDAQPEELDVAICVDRIETAFDLQVRRIESKWAGLRSFLPDGDPVAGFAQDAPGFFWLAGQGGYGIQSAPALARAAAALVRGRAVPGDIADLGVSATCLAPARVREMA